MFVTAFANFVEKEGDPFIDGPSAKNHGCISDYRYAESILRLGISQGSEFLQCAEGIELAQNASESIIQTLSQAFEDYKRQNLGKLDQRYNEFIQRIRAEYHTQIVSK